MTGCRGALLLTVFLAACSSARPGSGPAEPKRVASGLNFEAYEGAFAGQRRIVDAEEAMPAAAEEAAILIEKRLGLVTDPERPRVIRIEDGSFSTVLTSRVVAGRMVQFVSLPAAPLAQGRVDVETALLDALCRAALFDAGREAYPDWFLSGAPIWVSGSTPLLLHLAVLGGEDVLFDVDRIAPEIDLEGRGNSPLSSALFLGFIAEEFGADKLPVLSRALLSGNPRGAAAATFDTDPDSLPVAFDGYRLRVVSEVTDDPHVVELARTRSLPADRRVVSLSGLASIAPNRYVAAAVLEELALAQYEADEPDAAALTFARLERESAPYLMHPARDRLYFARTFASRGEDAAAALRLAGFVAEFPESDLAPAALGDLARILWRAGRTEEALTRYRELADEFPTSPEAREACLVLGDAEATSYRYAKALAYFERARPESDPRISGIESLRGALPPEAVEIVVTAFRDLEGADTERVEAGVRVLGDVGAYAEPVLLAEFRAMSDAERTPALQVRIIRVLEIWRLDMALAEFLFGDDREVIGAAMDSLDALGVPPARIFAMVSSGDAPAARAVFAERYGGAEELPEVGGLLRSQDYQDRVEAARRLALIDRPEALDALRSLAKDPSPQVRRAAVASLGTRREPATGRILESALEDKDPLIRSEAIRALAATGRWEPIRERGLVDPAPGVRIVAAGVLYVEDFQDETKNVEEKSRVIELLEDSDSGVRSTVTDLLIAAGPENGGAGAIAEELRGARTLGLAMRLVRVISRLGPGDFNYDPAGGAAERVRVADAFLEWWTLSQR